MTPPMTPYVEPLSQRHRLAVFLLSIFLFVTLVPLLVFYAIGYRFDFNDKIHNIKSVGGLYISSEALNTSMFLDDEPVENLRIFQRAAYIQNVGAGMHKVHVQGPGVTTWVKELPVFAHFVTEGASFNMPLVPQIRPVTQYQTISGAAVVRASSTLASVLAVASTTTDIKIATSSATSTYELNPEYTYIKALFASTTEDRQLLSQLEEMQKEKFAFSKIKAIPTTTATSTVVAHEMQLSEVAGEVYARWLGEPEKVPYYFCIKPNEATSTAVLYGRHIAAQVYGATLEGVASTTDTFEANNRICRREIKIDRLGQEVKWFTFIPNSHDLVLMHLSDGIYVVEIDDRSWQNTQLLYPGTDLDMLVDGNTIYVKKGKDYFEIYTQLLN